MSNGNLSLAEGYKMITAEYLTKILNFVIPVLLSIIVPAREALIILFVAVMIDTILGIIKSIRFKIFSSSRLKGVFLKLLMYTSLIIIGSIFDIVSAKIISLPVSIMQIFVLILATHEMISSLENVGSMGVNLPFIEILSKFKIPLHLDAIRERVYGNNLIQDIKDEAAIILGKDKAEIYQYWITILKRISKELQSYLISDKVKVTNALNVRITGFMSAIRDKDPGYVDYLCSLTLKILPYTKDQLYILANIGIDYKEKPEQEFL